MGNAKSKNSRYDSYSVKGPPTRSNSDPSSIYIYSQKQNHSQKKHSRKQKVSSKTGSKINHGSSNSVTLPSTSSSFSMLNDTKGEIILATSTPNEYSISLPQSKYSSSAKQYSSSQNLLQEDSSSKPGDYLNLEEEFKKLNINFETDLMSFINFSNDTIKETEKIKETEDENKTYIHHYGKSETKKPTSLFESGSKTSYNHNETEKPIVSLQNESKTSYRNETNKLELSLETESLYSSETKKSSLSLENESKKSHINSKQSKEDINKYSRLGLEENIALRQGKEELKKSSKKAKEGLNSKQSSRHHHSRNEKRKSSQDNSEDIRRSSKLNNDELRSSLKQNSDELKKSTTNKIENLIVQSISGDYPTRRNDISSKNHIENYPSRQNDYVSSDLKLHKTLPVPSTDELNNFMVKFNNI